MATNINKLKKKLLTLPVNERAFLAKLLIRSLDSEEEDDPELEKKWIEEGNRRYKEYKLGKKTARNAIDVMKDARSRIS